MQGCDGKLPVDAEKPAPTIDFECTHLKRGHIPSDLLYRIAPKRAFTTWSNFSGNNIFDNAAARADLNFRYTVPWVAGVRRTVAWLDENHKIEDSDADPFDDRVIAAWERLSARMGEELAGIG